MAPRARALAPLLLLALQPAAAGCLGLGLPDIIIENREGREAVGRIELLDGSGEPAAERAFRVAPRGEEDLGPLVRRGGTYRANLTLEDGRSLAVGLAMARDYHAHRLVLDAAGLSHVPEIR